MRKNPTFDGRVGERFGYDARSSSQGGAHARRRSTAGGHVERRGAGAGGAPGPSAPPEKPLRALLLQVLYSTRSERLLREQRDYNLLFWWFVGLNMDDPIWDPTVFTKNRERLLAGEIAQAFFARVLAQARQHGV